MDRRLIALPLLVLLAGGVIVRQIEVTRERVTGAARPVEIAEPEETVVEPEPPVVARVPAPVPVRTADELRTLAESRFPDEVILSYARHRDFRPSAEEVIALKAAGMSDVLLGRLLGVPEPDPAPPQVSVVVEVPPVQVYTTVFAPVHVTVVEAPPPVPPDPYYDYPVVVGSVVPCSPHDPPDLSFPPIYQKPPFFKTHKPLPTKRLPAQSPVPSPKSQVARGVRPPAD
jgi:hypothetical protein